MTSREEYELESAVRSFHVYKPTWTPVIGEELTAEREPGNSEDRFAVALKKGGATVGHVPREISKLCWLFVHHGTITAEVTVTGQRRSPILQGGLEIPCVLRFNGSTKNINRLRTFFSRKYK